MIHRDTHEDIAVLRIEHGKVNALDTELITHLVTALEAETRTASRAVILTGTNKTFCAGVDLRRLVDGGESYVSRFLPLLDALFRAALDFSKPLIAAINGHAIAGGCILAACCDHRALVRNNSRMGVTELAVGVPFPALPLAIISARCPPNTLRDLVFSARTVTDETALSAGLCDALIAPEELLTHSLSIARSYAKVSPTAYALARKTFAEPIYATTERQRPLDTQAHSVWLAAETSRSIDAYLTSLARKP